MNEILRQIAAFGLGPPSGESVAVDDDAWRAVAPTVTAQRLTGLAAAAAAEGALTLSAVSQEDLIERDLTVQRQTLRAERLMGEVHDALLAEGIEHLVLKGASTAYRSYPDPAHRPFVDVDLLVRASDLQRAGRVCERLGGSRRVPELRPGFDRRFAKSITYQHTDGVEIDLHRTLARGPLTHLVRETDLWATTSTFTSNGGRQFPALSEDTSFLHACIHAAGAPGQPRWLTVRDVVATSTEADLEQCQHLARRWHGTAVVVNAVDRAKDRGLPIPPELDSWSSALHATAREQRIASTYLEAGTSERAIALAALRAVPGPVGKARYAMALAFPSARNRRGRQRSVADQIRRVAGRHS